MIEKKITKEDIISLGWVVYIHNKVFIIDRFKLFWGEDNPTVLSIDVFLKGEVLKNYSGSQIFRGRLVADNPKEELKTIMAQIGII